MDNVTHTLLGIAAAELLVTTRLKTRPQGRAPLWLASALANNLPDLDVALTWGKNSDRLDYLLHHRGHTHTLLLAPLQGLALLAILWLLWRKRQGLPWKEIILLCLIGPILHLTADSWNTYGVHPFWPWNNQWYYGDLIFIVEPWLWLAFLPVIWHRAQSFLGKGIAIFLVAGILGLSWYHPFMQLLPTIAVTIAAVVWLGAQKLIRDDRKRILSAFMICAIIFLLFGSAQAKVRERFVGPGKEVTVLTHPANPFCSSVFTAGFEGSTYRASIYTTAPWPSLVPASSCGNFIEKETSANLKPIPGASPSAESVPIGAFTSTRSEFDRLAATCRGRAFLRFARIPFWFQEEGRDYFGDLRFDRDRAVSFAEIPLGSDLGCPRFEPPWVGRFFPTP